MMVVDEHGDEKLDFGIMKRREKEKHSGGGVQNAKYDTARLKMQTNAIKTKEERQSLIHRSVVSNNFLIKKHG
jgi:hypothetical protein